MGAAWGKVPEIVVTPRIESGDNTAVQPSEIVI